MADGLMDLADYIGRLVACRKCGRVLGKLQHQGDAGYRLLYAATLEAPPSGEPWELKRARKPKADGLIALAPGAQPPESWVPSDPSDDSQGEVTHGTLIPLTDRVRCLCGFVTTLSHLTSREFVRSDA